MLLEARSLYKRFGSFEAVGIDIEVQEGECLALLGPNGAVDDGRNAWEGLQFADSGDIRIFGKDIRKQRTTIMQDVGVMLQDTQLYKKFTVAETVQLFASFFKSPLPVYDVISMVQLSDKANVRLEALSVVKSSEFIWPVLL